MLCTPIYAPAEQLDRPGSTPPPAWHRAPCTAPACPLAAPGATHLLPPCSTCIYMPDLLPLQCFPPLNPCISAHSLVDRPLVGRPIVAALAGAVFKLERHLHIWEGSSTPERKSKSGDVRASCVLVAACGRWARRSIALLPAHRPHARCYACMGACTAPLAAALLASSRSCCAA